MLLNAGWLECPLARAQQGLPPSQPAPVKAGLKPILIACSAITWRHQRPSYPADAVWIVHGRLTPVRAALQPLCAWSYQFTAQRERARSVPDQTLQALVPTQTTQPIERKTDMTNRDRIRVAANRSIKPGRSRGTPATQTRWRSSASGAHYFRLLKNSGISTTSIRWLALSTKYRISPSDNRVTLI